jgi:NAD(P)-dependent dehydrogenase (short-subunit alcohol dehydrogenase family)
MTLRGKNVLVTGASRGIGAAIARSVANQGAKVALHYVNNQKKAQAVLGGLPDPETHILVQADLTRTDAAKKLWQESVESLGYIDVIVNNAGKQYTAGVESDNELWDDTWDKTLQLNLTAAADLCRDAINHFRSRKVGGRIINIASRAGHRGDGPDYMHYAAAKGGLLALTKSIARGFAKDDILAFAITPGFTETDLATDILNEMGHEAATREIPLGDLAQPEEIGETVAFLCSDVVRHMTGATIDINGASYVR